tara:strand:+ start:860 stop:2122 length:1263 start_codon:yes stop_codon:yes gene_type:complete
MPLKNSTPINPAAMRIDYSPLARAQQAKSAGLMQLSGAVKAGIGKAQDKRKKSLEDAESLKIVKAMVGSDTDLQKRLTDSGIDINELDKNVNTQELLGLVAQLKKHKLNVETQESNIKAKETEIALNQAKIDNLPAELALKGAETASNVAYQDMMGNAASRPPAPSEAEANIQRVLKANPDMTYSDVVNTLSKINSPSEADAEIARVLKANPDMTYSDVVNTLSSINSLSSDPITGELTNVNRLLNTSTSITPEPKPQTPLPKAPQKTLWDRTESTGIFNAAKNLIQRGTGQAGINIADPEMQKDITAFDLASKGLIQILALNKRYTVSEMNEIKKKITVTANWWTDEQTLQSKLQALDEWARKEMKKAQSDANNRRLDGPTREQAEKDIIGFQNYLGELGVPQKGEPPSNGIKFIGWED